MKIKSLLQKYIARVSIGTILSFVLVLIFTWEVNNRHFFCFENGKCFTVWALGKGVIIVPYKYYGITKPEEYAFSVDSGAGAFGASIYLSKNTKHEFVVSVYRGIDNSNGKILIVDYKSGSNEDHRKEIEFNAIQDEVYNYTTVTDFIHSTTLSRFDKYEQQVIIAKYHFFRNGYQPLTIIFLTVLLLRYIGCRPDLEQKSTSQKIKAISLFGAYTVAESALVLVLDIVVPIAILFVILSAVSFWQDPSGIVSSWFGGSK